MYTGELKQKVLVTSVTNALGRTIVGALNDATIQTVSTSHTQLNWADVEILKHFIQQSNISIIINTFSLDPAFTDKHDQYAETIACACAATNTAVVHLSDYHVFGEPTKNTYYETDKANPSDNFGEKLAAAEATIIQNCERHLVLRLSWLIDSNSDNLFTRVLDALECGQEICLRDDAKGSPTWVGDVARVLVGISKQLFAGAENWGVFHYCSDDKCTEFEFGSQVVNSFAEIKEPIGNLQATKQETLNKESNTPFEPKSAVLSCRRIRNNFGIQPRTWRQGMKKQINLWLEHNRVDAVS